MASSKQSYGLQIALAIFGLLAVTGWAAWYVTFRESAALQAATAAARTELTNATNGLKKSDEDIQAMKAQLGYTHEQVGSDSPGATNTVLGAGQTDLAKVTTKYSLPTQTFAAGVEFLMKRLDDTVTELNTTKSELTTANSEIAALKGRYQVLVDEHQKAREKTEADNKELARSKDEESRAKQKQIDDLRTAKADLETEYDAAKAAWTAEKTKSEAELKDLTARVDDLRDKLKSATRTSFEVPDGVVRWVDNAARLVWIDLGSEDGLRVGTSFSVYRKAHHGIARDASDIKGQIEVTRIMDGHRAEAKIVDDQIYDPIANNDPIYTPLWSRGRQEKFAVVGEIDLDSDGIKDREEFHDLIADAGAKLIHEIDDTGKRVRYIRFPQEFVDWNEGDPLLDSDTKYLILGEIPDPSLVAEEKERERRIAIAEQLKVLRAEARRLGIDEIRLSDFLARMGHIPQQRVFIPGVVNRPFNLRNGASSVTTDEAVKDRSAAGSVSGVYGRSKRLKPQSAENAVSPVYKGGSK